ncbi:hypothetical protein PESP_a1401 [Pseudoalteromonas espejiana DSM 9414]|nr:hypothetical protein PESP_a1401 [Pseudoalteromonas espejiana DSM 9414]
MGRNFCYALVFCSAVYTGFTSKNTLKAISKLSQKAIH